MHLWPLNFPRPIFRNAYAVYRGHLSPRLNSWIALLSNNESQKKNGTSLSSLMITRLFSLSWPKRHALVHFQPSFEYIVCCLICTTSYVLSTIYQNPEPLGVSFFLRWQIRCLHAFPVFYLHGSVTSAVIRKGHLPTLYLNAKHKIEDH